MCLNSCMLYMCSDTTSHLLSLASKATQCARKSAKHVSSLPLDE